MLQPSTEARRANRWRQRAILARSGDFWAAQNGGWHAVPWARVAACGRVTTANTVAIHVKQFTDNGCSVYPVGVSTCGSVHSCPVCSAKIRARRSAETRTAAVAHTAAGGTLSMLTLTVRHGPEHTLRSLLGVLSDAWRSLQQSDEWRPIRSRMVGMIRAMEITHGLADPGGSWHPHYHVLMFWPDGQQLDDAELSWLSDAWADRVESRLGARPGAVGVHHKLMNAAAAEYVTKIAQEVTRSDLKAGSRSVWGIVQALSDGEAWAVRAWFEYTRATKGLRAIQWSRGLRAHFGLGDVEQTDEEIVAADVDGEVFATIPSASWSRMMRCGYGEVPPALLYLQRVEQTRELIRVLTGPADSPPKQLELI